MDNDFQHMLGAAASPRRQGLWRFILRRKAIPCAIICGLVLAGLTAWFTYWLAIQDYTCPGWANDCNVRPSVAWIKRHLPTVQGIVSTVHGIGLGILAYPAYIFAEAAIWPVLTHEAYDLVSLDMYLSATRGSVPGLLQAIRNVGTGRWSTVMICAAIITSLTTADRIVVGHVYNFGNVTKIYESNYTGGGGIGLALRIEYPLGAFPAPVTSASSFFTSWSKDLSIEPLPELRDFIVDRTYFAQLGNFSISGLKAEKVITCSGQLIDIVEDVKSNIFRVATSFPDTQSSIPLRMQGRLAVWVDSVQYISNVSTTTNLVFASINGTIDKGVSTPATKNMVNNKDYPINHISALKCAVEVTLKQSMIEIGTGPWPDNGNLAVSELQTVLGPGKNTSEFGPLGDVAEWLGGVVASLGNSVYGTQPLFGKNGAGRPPTAITTTQSDFEPEEWTQDELIEFIHISSGALALSMSTQWNKARITVHSKLSVQQLVPFNAWILLIPAVIVLLTTVFLAVWLARAYKHSRIQSVQAGKTSDMIWSTQNRSMWEGVDELRSGAHDSEKLEKMKVRYTLVADEHVHMGLTWDKPGQQSEYGTPLKEYASYTSKHTAVEVQQYV